MNFSTLSYYILPNSEPAYIRRWRPTPGGVLFACMEYQSPYAHEWIEIVW